MAYLHEGRALWSNMNNNEQDIIKLTPQYADVLRNKRPELVKLVQPSSLWSHLRRYQVLNEAVEERIKLNSTTQDMVARLLDHLECGPSYRLHAFLRACYLTNQGHVIQLVGFDEEMYAGDSPPESDTQELASSPKAKAKSGRTFTQQREYYKSKLAKSPIYEYATRSPFAHLGEIFTNIQLVDNQNDKWLTRHHSIRSNLKKIQLNDVFKEDGNKHLSIILEGKPGNGKSTIMKSCAVDWARSKDEDRGLRHGGNSSLLEKELLIFIDKRHEGETLDETIKNAIRGTNAEKEDGLHFLRENPEKTFLFMDGLDEFLRKEVREEILKLAEDCRANILVSCRQGHPYLEDKMGCFNRHIRIEGFRPEDAMDFVKSFLKVLSSGNDDPGVLHQRCETLCSFLSRKETHTMYASPINCVFLCILYSSGEVTKDQLSTLTSKDLYARQQGLLLKREYAKVSDADERSKIEMAAQTTIRGIHRMALHSLLHEEKQSSYSTEEAQRFGINLSSPAMVMLQVEYEDTADGPRKVFSWPHQTIKEFHAANAAKDPAIMYFIASKPQLNEVTKFLMSSLIDTEPEFVKELMTAVLLLQSKSPSCLESTLKKFTSRFSKQKHACCEIAELKQFVGEQDVDKLLQQELSDTKVPSLQRLTDIQKCLGGGDWMVRNQHTFIALQNMTSDYQSTSPLADIIHPFLPSVFYGNVMNAINTIPDMFYEVYSNIKNINIAEFWEHAAFREWSTAVLLLPSADEKVVFKMEYSNPGLPVRLFMIPAREKGDPVDIFCYTTITLELNSIVIADISHPFVTKFVKTCARVDYLYIVTEDDPADKESEVWKNTIVEMNKIFRPKKGIKTNPDCKCILTVEDMKELRDLDIRLLGEDGYFVTISDDVASGSDD